MRLFDYFKALKQTFRLNKARSLLTLSGIVIGSGSIVMLAGLLGSAESALVQLNQGVNQSDTLRVDTEEPPQHQIERPQRELSRADGQALAERLDDVDVAIETRREAQAKYRGKQKRVRLVGGGPHSLEMYRLGLEKGRFLQDQDQGKRVAVVGFEIWKELLEKHPDPLGIQLLVDDQSWTIIGVLKHKPVMGHGDGTWMWDRRILVPQVTFDAVFAPSHTISSIFLKAKAARPGEKFMTAIGTMSDRLLLRRHLGVRNFKVDDRKGGNQEKLIISIIQVLLLGTGLMSMFVGGINIMNIMLVTVTERTREIGIRRAIGASPLEILGQFVLEAAAVSLIGGLIGIAGGVALNWLAVLGLNSAFGGWDFLLELWSIALGLGLAVITGVIFGLFPAWRAARLNPVEALRYE